MVAKSRATGQARIYEVKSSHVSINAAASLVRSTSSIMRRRRASAWRLACGQLRWHVRHPHRRNYRTCEERVPAFAAR